MLEAATANRPVGSDNAEPATVKGAFAPVSGVAEAEAYTRKLALGHYENFSVVSLLLPRELRQDFCNIYAFCRTADDLGDEVRDRQAALEYLRGFGQQTRACYAGRAETAVFVALQRTIRKYDIPIGPFLDLIDAFEQDQRVTRYETFGQLVDYCRRSADPVGRLVLYLCGYRDEERQELSDKTCTALQLANFWQDVKRDMVELNRIYIPRESMVRFGVSEAQIRELRFHENFRRLMEFEVQRTEELFVEGERLLPMVSRAVRGQIALFGRGGRAVLSAIRRQGYDTLSRRPALSRWQKGKLVAGMLASRLLSFGGER